MRAELSRRGREESRRRCRSIVEDERQRDRPRPPCARRVAGEPTGARRLGAGWSLGFRGPATAWKRPQHTSLYSWIGVLRAWGYWGLGKPRGSGVLSQAQSTPTMRLGGIPLSFPFSQLGQHTRGSPRFIAHPADAESGGILDFQGRACSSWAARRKSVASSPKRPTK